MYWMLVIRDQVVQFFFVGVGEKLIIVIEQMVCFYECYEVVKVFYF